MNPRHHSPARGPGDVPVAYAPGVDSTALISAPTGATGPSDTPDASPLSGDILDAPTFSVRHPAGDLQGAPADDPQHLMCSECGAIGWHARRCSASARRVDETDWNEALDGWASEQANRQPVYLEETLQDRPDPD